MRTESLRIYICGPSDNEKRVEIKYPQATVISDDKQTHFVTDKEGKTFVVLSNEVKSVHIERHFDNDF